MYIYIYVILYIGDVYIYIYIYICTQYLLILWAMTLDGFEAGLGCGWQVGCTPLVAGKMLSAHRTLSAGHLACKAGPGA